jgi:hypothetical protein
VNFASGGPPASAKQLTYLLSLLRAIGHEDFKAARHPLGLTQRQALGKFTTREASELIDQLINGEPPAPDAAPPRILPAPARAPSARARAKEAAAADTQASVAMGLPADILADELRRRGWTVTEPA